MHELVITVVSRDRTGLIADVTEVLAELGGNLKSSSMSLLEGHFAWTLVVDVEATAQHVETQLLGVCPTGVTVSTLDRVSTDSVRDTQRVIVSVHGMDRIGLIAGVSRAIADAGGNIAELATHIHNDLYIGTAEVDFPADLEVDQIRASLATVGQQLGVTVTARREETDDL